MPAAAPNRWVHPEEYLRGELQSGARHEYFAGELVAMAESSANHNHIAGNLFGELHHHLHGKKCAPFKNDMKAHIQLQNDDLFYYPDVMVNCEPAGQHEHYCDTPTLIIEVLSPDTEAKDRREKRLAYERIDALKTYVLVSQERREVFIFRRSERGWDREVLPDDGNVLRVLDLEFSIGLDAIYARTGL